MEKKNKLKIAVTSAKLEHIKRGVETWAKDTSHCLHQKGIDVTLYKGSGACRQDYEKTIHSVKENTPQSVKLLKIIPRFCWRIGLGNGEQIEETTFALSLIREARKKKFDIIHTQDAHVANALRVAAKLNWIPSKVILGHGTEEPFDFIKKFKYIQHLAPYHLKEAEDNCGHKPGWYAIGNFVFTDTFKPGNNPRLRQELGIPEDALVVLSVAAVKSTHKRVDYLIDEVRRLVQSGRNVYLVVAGSTTKESDWIMKAGQDKLGGHVRFLLNQPHQKLPGILNMADVFALGSIKEMMPIALLEALAAGLPCLVNRYPVLEWMVGPGGECIDMSKEGALAKALMKYEDAGYRQPKAAAARSHAVNYFSTDVVVDQYIQMYEKILYGSGTS